MALYMIGIGLWDEKDITLKGLEAVKSCSHVYLETYTSKLECSVSDLEKTYGKKIILADRESVESNPDEILNNAAKGNAAFLIIGDVFAATTHIDLRNRAQKRGIDVKIINNASVLTAVGITGLELYKFGKVTSIPFENENINSPIDVYRMNNKIGLHTLFLLDLRPEQDRFMTINDAAKYLLNHGAEDKLALGCAGLGSGEPQIISAKLSALKDEEFKLYPQCLIIPGRLHFVEEEAVEKWKKR